jgi:hypothetical protein
MHLAVLAKTTMVLFETIPIPQLVLESAEISHKITDKNQ